MRSASDSQERFSLSERLSAHVDSYVPVYGMRPELTILKAFAVQEMESSGSYTGDMSSEYYFRRALKNISNGLILQEIIDNGIDMFAEMESYQDSPASGNDPSEIIHYYVVKDEYDRIEKELAERTADNENLFTATRGKGDKRRIILHDKSRLAATTENIFKMKEDMMCSRTVWHMCAPEEVHTEIKHVPVFSDNVSPEEFLSRAREEHILTEESAESYLAYRQWYKDNRAEINRVLDQYNEDFERYMERFGELD